MNTSELKAEVQQRAKDVHSSVVDVRRHLHANPELSFQEYKTSAYVADRLTALGIEFQDGFVETGIVAHVRGKNPDAKIIALRADMDALPIHEANEVSYRSLNEGLMHACGHDVHTSSLLGVAEVLHGMRDHFEGTVKLIFQPGEEKLPGGASLMMAEGALKNPAPAKIFGQHVFPDLAAGKVGFRPGMYMASCDEIYVTVTGKGGHGAMPHKCIDPILIASQIIVALQQLVSRRANPEIPTVLSFGTFMAKGATNVIPNEAKLEGTFRTFNEVWREEAHALMKDMAESMARSMGAEIDFDIRKGYPFLVNDEETTHRARAAAEEFLGASNVVELPIRPTAEDFAYYSQEIPACFYRLGTAAEDGEYSAPVHNAKFDIDESALETSVGLMTWLALDALKQ